MTKLTKDETKCVKYIIEAFASCGMGISYLIEERDEALMQVLRCLFSQLSMETADWYLKQVLAKVSFTVEAKAKEYYQTRLDQQGYLESLGKENPSLLMIENPVNAEILEESLNLMCTRKILNTIISSADEEAKKERYLYYKKAVDAKGKEIAKYIAKSQRQVV